MAKKMRIWTESMSHNGVNAAPVRTWTATGSVFAAVKYSKVLIDYARHDSDPIQPCDAI